MVRPPGFGPGFSPWQGDEESVDWAGFEFWVLKEYHPVYAARNRIHYAKEYANCLFRGDFCELRLLSDDKRVHVMKALASLSKYLGVHGYFTGLIKGYGLKWASRNADDLIIARLTKPRNSEEMYEWMRRVKQAFPGFALFIDFMAATGLRYVEAVNSWNLIVDLAKRGRLTDYYDEHKQVLEHFRFKDLFIRRSKKAFISFVSIKLIANVAAGDTLGMNALACRVRKRRLTQRFGDIREFHGSILTRTHSQPEIDFLHGRVSTGVFMTNYFNPAWISDLGERTLKAAEQLLAKIN
jgi:hypothetical protein